MQRAINGLFKGIEILISVFLSVMIILVFANVILRYVFNTGFASSEEITRICFIYLVYLGSIEAMRDNRHLLIESVIVRIKPLGQKLLYSVIQILIIWLMGSLAFGSFGLMLQNINNRWIATGIPVWFVHLSGLIMGVSILLLAIGNLVQLWISKKSVVELISARDEDSAAID